MAVLNVSTYDPLPEDEFIFDTNVWIAVFEPLANTRLEAQRAYSSFFQKITLSGNKIYIPAIVISEYINVLLRIDFRLWKNRENNEYGDFKEDYRKTDRYREKSTLIATTLKKKIFPKCVKLNDNLSMPNINVILDNLPHSDFNDLFLMELSKNHNLKIVSDDRDFYLSNNLSVFSCL